MKVIDEKAKSRKLIGGILLIVLATWMALSEAMEAGLFTAWANFVIFIYATYVAGNVGQKYIYKVDKKEIQNPYEKNK